MWLEAPPWSVNYAPLAPKGSMTHIFIMMLLITQVKFSHPKLGHY